MRTKEMMGVILTLTLFLGIAPFAIAAPSPFSVAGHVYLGTAAVSGADVTVTNLNISESLTTITDSNGAYVVNLGSMSGHSAGDNIQVTATYNGMTGTNSAPRSENLSDSPQIIDVTLEPVVSIVEIKAGDGGDLPATIPVGETFTVLITENGNPVGVGTNVAFRLPYDAGDPVTVSTDSNGKVTYKPLITGTLGIRVLDSTGTAVANATVSVITTGTQTLGSITISPTSCTLDINDSQTFTAVCRDTHSGVMTCPTLTWTSSSTAVGTITAGEFTAIAAGTTTITASAEGVTSTAATVTVNAESSVDEPVTGGTGTAISGDAHAEVTLNDTSVSGTVKVAEIGDPINDTSSSASGNNTGLGLGPTANQLIKGAVITVDPSVKAALLADVNKTSWVYIRLNYSQSVVDSRGIDEGSINIWKYNTSIDSWQAVKDQPYCIGNGRNTADNYVWVNVTELSTFALVGTKTAVYYHHGGGGGGGAGTYPPGWYATPTVTATAAHRATPGVTPGVTPPGEAVTKPTKPAAEGEATPAAAEEAATAKKKTPGFEAVFAIAGLLAVAYVLMRRRE